MNEASKNHQRRLLNGDYDLYFKGKGLDIGCGNDPVLPNVHRWDKLEGDATFLEGIAESSYDFIHSSHCLEHLHNPELAISNWVKVLKPGGYLIVTVPDFFLYEKKHMPSKFNTDHKQFFTIGRYQGPTSVLDVFNHTQLQILRIQLNEQGFNYDDKESDQTLTGAQSEIEVIARKQLDHFWT